MIYTLRELLQWDVSREVVPGVWVAARPVGPPLNWRLRAAWAVLRGRADAFTWPDERPRSWCMPDTRLVLNTARQPSKRTGTMLDR